MEKWNKKVLKIGLPVILIIFGFNHLEYAFRSGLLGKRHHSQEIAVRKEEGPIGHSTIGIDESSLGAAGSEMFLRFATLAAWEYDRETNPPPPEAIENLSGKDVSVIGFMYPLEPGIRIRNFCLLRTTQTCCYGPRPQYNQYILIQLAKPVKFERLRPVIVRGKFFVEARPDEGYIYRMEGTDVTPVGEDDVERDALSAATEANLPVLNFDLLEQMEQQKGNRRVSFPRDLEVLDGKRVVVTGYLVGYPGGNPEKIIIGKYWWDGVSRGKRPGLYNAVMVEMRPGVTPPPIWKEKATVTGRARIIRDRAKWEKGGILRIEDATRGVGGKKGWRDFFGNRPVLPVFAEVLILLVFFSFAFHRPLLRRFGFAFVRKGPD